VAVAEMAAETGVGLTVADVDGRAEAFSEVPGRCVVATRDPEALAQRAAAAGVSAHVLGVAGGRRIQLGSVIDLALDEVAAQRRYALPERLQVSDASRSSSSTL
jgi:phosphoribosylformylglycinamidine (FGAM) synthase-like enzyme